MGATNRLRGQPGHYVCFNPRARDGRDWLRRAERSALLSFNPRARDGRDVWLNTMTPPSRSFNPRARDGRDFISFCYISLPDKFQSTRP